MAKFDQKTSFNNAIITKKNGEFVITEYKVTKDGTEEVGKWNLTEKLDNVADTEYVALSFVVKTELDSE